MRRKPDSLLPIEAALLGAGLDLARRGTEEVHGYALARELKEIEGARRLTAHGTLYRALERLEKLGFVESRWEDPMDAAAESRPRRRLYKVNAAGAGAFAAAMANQPVDLRAGASRLAPE